MCEVAGSLSESDVVELAEHFAAMKRISAGEAPVAELVRAGERIHAEHCAKCHVLPDDADVENALGIPLHGQRPAYLKMALEAYLDGDRQTLVPAMAEQLAQLDDDDVGALINYYSSYQP
jgi:cytochrome c553